MIGVDGKEQRKLLIAVAVLVLAGGFFIGQGFCVFANNRRIIAEFRDSGVEWKRELASGMEEEDVRDMRNQKLIENLEHISMEQEIYFDDGASKGEARISNAPDALFGCTVSLIRDATREVVYESNVIDPGYHIRYIELETKLKKGFYPCTIVWSFYTEEDEYVGEMAWKAVVIIKE